MGVIKSMLVDIVYTEVKLIGKNVKSDCGSENNVG